nr:sodium-dependent dopamine transporter-like [Lytechinus pictus]
MSRVRRFSEDIQEMIGSLPSIVWRICWKFISPTFVFVMFIVSMVLSEPLTYEEYVYPQWGNVLAWLFASSSMVIVPLGVIWQLIVAPGSGFKEKFAYAITPRAEHDLIREKGEITRFKAKHWLSL